MNAAFRNFPPPDVTEWRERRPELRLQAIRDAFGVDEQATLGKAFKKMDTVKTFRYYSETYGPAFGADRVSRELRAWEPKHGEVRACECHHWEPRSPRRRPRSPRA